MGIRVAVGAQNAGFTFLRQSSGTNTLTFNVKNAGTTDSAFGLNFRADMEADLRQEGPPNCDIVPEPGTLTLLGIGLLGIVGARSARKRHKQQKYAA